MKILVTGAKGFIGSNLCLHLKECKDEVFEFDIDTPKEDLESFIAQADFIVHLAGINRPMDVSEFTDGNVNFTKHLLDVVEKVGCCAPILFGSSTQAALDNPYGQSKKMAEDLLFAFGHSHDNPVCVCRFYNVFGKWCRPNYNSVIATFCYNVANGLPLSINEMAAPIDFIYIDDLVRYIDGLVKGVKGAGSGTDGIIYAEPHYKRSLREIADLLYSFRESRKNLMVPVIDEPFAKALYSTYLTYLPESEFSYELDMHKDSRGSFTEILKTEGHGQISVNISKPGITKGNHYHHTKNEKYLVVHGTCEIKFRKIGTNKVITYVCDDKVMQVVDIPPGYTHSITNIGTDDSVTIMWANELYDPNNPDTYYCPVEQG